MIERDIIKLYEEVLSGKRRRFPRDFWHPTMNGKEKARELMRYLIHEKLKWDRQTFCDHYDRKFLLQYKLNGALYGVYGGKMYRYASDALKDWNLYQWEMKKISRETRFSLTAEQEDEIHRQIRKILETENDVEN